MSTSSTKKEALDGYVSSKEASRVSGYTQAHLRNMASEGRISCLRVENKGKYYYLLEDVMKNSKLKKITVLYARQTKKEKLEEEVAKLKEKFDGEVITDTESVISLRDGLLRVLDLLEKERLDKIVVLNKQKLMFAGWDILEVFIKQRRVELIELDEEMPREDLLEDIDDTKAFVESLRS